jgi:sigma-E factor negative regulatory protein RseB
MLSRSLVPLALACAAIAGVRRRGRSPGRDAARRRRRTRCAPGCCASTKPPSRRNFQGTFVVSGGGGVANAKISHFHDGPNQYERIESLDGRQRKVYPPQRRRPHALAGEQGGDDRAARPAQLVPGAAAGGRRHARRVVRDAARGLDRVADHEADVLAVKARDKYRYGYRLWADRASGLLLRADVIGERGEILETAAFSRSRSACARSPTASSRR